MKNKILTIIAFSIISTSALAQANPGMSADSTFSPSMTNPSIAPLPKAQTTSSSKSIQLPYRQLYQCPSLLGGSLGGGDWGYYGCHGQISYETTCLTIEAPKELHSACTAL